MKCSGNRTKAKQAPARTLLNESTNAALREPPPGLEVVETGGHSPPVYASIIH